MDYRFHLAAILHSETLPLRQEEFHGPRLVVVAAVKEGIQFKERLYAILGGSNFEQFMPNGLGNQDLREEKAQQRKLAEMF